MKNFRKNRDAEKLINSFIGEAIGVLLLGEESPMGRLDNLMDVEAACCKKCSESFATMNYPCEGCRFKARLSNIVDVLMDENEAQDNT